MICNLIATGMTNKAAVEDKYSQIYIEDGIMFCVIKSKHLDVSIAKTMVTARVKYTKSKSYPMVIDASHVRSVTKEARDYFSADYAISHVKAAAILAPSLIVRLLANFFLTFDKPKVTTKVFVSQQEAVEWLKQYR